MSSHRFLTFLLLIASVDLVHAQEPLGQLGPWPPGALTLLVGMWVALNALSESRFDILPPVVVARILHKIPILRRFLTSDGQAGGLVKQLVLTSVNHSGRSISQEWDTLILESAPTGNFVDTHDIHAWSKGNEGSFNLQINVGEVDLSKMGRAFDELLKELDFDLARPRIDQLLRLWHALKMYQQYPEQAEWQGSLGKGLLDEAVSYYKGRMESVAPTSYQPQNNLTGTMLKVHYPDCQYGPGEVPEGATTRKEPVSAKHLAVMLAFTEHVHGNRFEPINPLILCVWIWHTQRQHPHDSLLFQLPSSQRFIFPQPEKEASEKFPPTRNVLNLSSKDWQIDGGHARFFLPYAWFFGLWCLSLVTVAIITFFAIVSGGANPNMAATLGLLFVKPYSRDSYIFSDAGYPPSWNGRRQIRWEEGYACAVFRGKFYRRMGPSGNSFSRAILAYAVAWVSWRFRVQLRDVLQFTQPSIPPKWVTIVALFLEVGALLICLVNTITHSIRRQFKASAACAMLTCYIGAILVVTPLRNWLLVSEVGLLAAVPYAALIPRGVGPSYKPFVSYNFLIWCHIIASSCFYDVLIIR